MPRLHYKWKDVEEESLNPRLSRKLVTGEKIMLAQIRLKKGGVVPAHRHVHEQMSHLLEGSLRFTLSGKDYLINAGEVLRIPSNQEHSVVALEDSLALDVFSPIRDDWLGGDDSYLRGSNTRGKPRSKLARR